MEYCEEVPTNLVADLEKHTGLRGRRVLLVAMEMGRDFSGAGKDVFGDDRPLSHPAQAHRSTAVHPVLYYFNKVTHAENEGKFVTSSGICSPQPPPIFFFLILVMGFIFFLFSVNVFIHVVYSYRIVDVDV